MDAIEEIIPKMHNINSAAVEVNKERARISERITTVSAISQESAAAAEEITASAQEMHDASEEVSKAANHLEELTEGVMEEIKVFKLK